VYEVGLFSAFTAWHVMPGIEGPEGELHSHDYRLEAVIARDELDDRGMVCDLDVLQAAVDRMLARVRDRDLDEIRPPEAEAVTVEILARWAHEELARAIGALPGTLAVRVWESPIAFGGYRAPLSMSSL
jgi:6-pyruvoyltetrahydropterin/6-carboxytetrahydropterin synthase